MDRDAAGVYVGRLLSLMCVIVLMATTSVSVEATEWVKVGGTHKYDRYVDMTTIGPSGGKATLWTLRDLRVERAIRNGPYRSITIKRQYDCGQQKSRPLQVRYYLEAMAQGSLLYAAPATREWSRVIPGSDDAAEMKVACRRYQGHVKTGEEPHATIK